MYRVLIIELLCLLAWPAIGQESRNPSDSFPLIGAEVAHSKREVNNWSLWQRRIAYNLAVYSADTELGVDRLSFGQALTSPIVLAQNQPASLKQGQESVPARATKSQGSNEQQPNAPKKDTSPGHIFWVIPAYKVEYGQEFQPLTPKEKFKEWAQGAYDPLGLGAGAVEAATLEHSSTDGFCGYGGGWVGYGKCFGALQLDANVSSFIGDYALTSLLHQDPRYFRLGKGSFGRRVWYSVARVFVTYNDAGRTVFYSSALSGTAIAAGISNFYYPKQDVGFGHTMSRIAIDLGNTALYDAAAEFWPDIHRKLRQIF